MEEHEARNLKNKLAAVNPGDLISVEWNDASTGKTSFENGCDIDVPVKSWGIFIGVLGTKVKHIVLAQNSFCYTNGFYDLDYTAIPISWACSVNTIAKQHIAKETASRLVKSFMAGRCHALARSRSPRTFRRCIFQQRLSFNGRPD